MTTENAPQQKEKRYSAGSSAHVLLAILFILNVVNYVDRSVLNAVFPLLKAEWGLSDKALGLLNSAFIITYMIFSPIFGWLGDRMIRKWIASVGVIVWSVATTLSAFAGNVLQLSGLRMIFGAGEAGFSTVAPTMIADLYSAKSRSKVLAIFYVAIPVGYALGYIIGGTVGTGFGWRTVFLVVGIPGIFLALPMLFVREPKRGQSEGVSGEAVEHMEAAVPLKRYLELFHNPSFVYCTVAMIFMTFVTGAFAAWGPAYFHRIRGLELDKAAYAFGIATLLAGIIGTFFGGWLGDKLQERTKAAYFLVSGIGMLLSVPAMLVILMAGSPKLYWVAVFVCEFFLFLNTGPANAVLLNVTMPNVRAGAFAINIFLIHALGDIISPPIVGAISDETNLQFALLITMPIISVAGGIAYLLGMRHLARDTESVLQKMNSEPQDIQGDHG